MALSLSRNTVVVFMLFCIVANAGLGSGAEIGNRAIGADNVPCQHGRYSANCRPGASAGRYQRGCEPEQRCRNIPPAGEDERKGEIN
jgi:Rapid ALkalinization Factor (RALF)